MNWRSEAKPEVEQQSRPACWCPRTLSGRAVSTSDQAGDVGFGKHKNSVHCGKGEKWTAHLFQSWPASPSLLQQGILVFALKPENNLILLQLLLPVSTARHQNGPEGGRWLPASLAGSSGAEPRAAISCGSWTPAASWEKLSDTVSVIHGEKKGQRTKAAVIVPGGTSFLDSSGWTVLWGLEPGSHAINIPRTNRQMTKQAHKSSPATTYPPGIRS